MMDVVDTFLKGRVPGGRMSAGDGMGSAGGIQIDKFGNTNMIGIGGPHPKMKVRGPGTVGTIWTACAPQGLFVEHHNKRLLVEKVDYISAPGWLDGGDSRAKLLDNRPGPVFLWTPICVCDFTETEHRMRLVSVPPGYTVKDVVDNTGFELVIEGDIPTTTAPTDWELNALRTLVDKDRRLKTRRLTIGV